MKIVIGCFYQYSPFLPFFERRSIALYHWPLYYPARQPSLIGELRNNYVEVLSLFTAYTPVVTCN